MRRTTAWRSTCRACDSGGLSLDDRGPAGRLPDVGVWGRAVISPAFWTRRVAAGLHNRDTMSDAPTSASLPPAGPSSDASADPSAGLSTPGDFDTDTRRALHDLVDLLRLEPLEHNLFRGQSKDNGGQAVFGGQVLGQALMARRPHGGPVAPGAFAARLLPARRRQDPAHRLRRGPHPRRRQLHRPGAWWPSSMARRSSTCRRRSRSARTARPTRTACPPRRRPRVSRRTTTCVTPTA